MAIAVEESWSGDHPVEFAGPGWWDGAVWNCGRYAADRRDRGRAENGIAVFDVAGAEGWE